MGVTRFSSLFVIALITSGQAQFGTQQDWQNRLAKVRNDIKAKNYLSAVTEAKAVYREGPSDDIRAEALFLSGLSADKAAIGLGRRALTEIPALKNGKPTTIQEYLEWKELEPYKRVGIVFLFHRYLTFLYDGEDYRELLAKYPKSRWACGVTFLLALLERRKGTLEGQLDKAAELITLAEKTLRECRIEELSCTLVGYIRGESRFLVDSYRFDDIAKARHYLDKAEAAAKRILRECPDPDAVREAEFELKRNKEDRKKIRNY